MAVRWTIEHSRRLVEVTFEGAAGMEGVTQLFDALEAENAIPYRKLFDATAAAGKIDDRFLAMVGKRIAGYQNPGPRAVVVPPSGPVDGLARLFIFLVDLDGRARVFRNGAEARQWLEGQ